MVRLIGKNKSVLKSAGSVSAGNKSANDLLVLFEGLASAGSITGVWNMNELYNSVVNSNWIDDLTADTARAQTGGTMTLNSVSLGSYDYTAEGLILCYTLAIPFFAYNIISTFIFSALFESIIKLKFIRIRTL